MIRTHCSAFHSYRKAFGYDHEFKSNNWIALMEPAMQTYNELHRLCVFGSEYDNALKQGLRSGRSALEMFEEGAIGQKLEGIKDMFNKKLEEESPSMGGWFFRRWSGA